MRIASMLILFYKTVEENVLPGDEIGMIDIRWTPSKPQVTETILQYAVEDREAEGMRSNEKAQVQSTRRKRSTQLDYCTVSKFRDPKDKDDPSRVLLFSNGHRFAWMPWVGLWTTWMAGSEKAKFFFFFHPSLARAVVDGYLMDI